MGEFLLQIKRRLRFIAKPLFQFPLLNISLSFSFGVILGEVLDIRIALVMVFLLSITLLNLSNRKYMCVLVTTLFLLLGIFRFQFYEHRISSYSHISSYNGREVKLCGKIINLTKLNTSSIRARLSKINVTGRTTPEATSISQVLMPASGDIIANLSDEEEGADLGSIICVQGTLTEPVNNDDFDYGAYLRSKGVYSIIDRVEILDVYTDERSLSDQFREAKKKVTRSVSDLLPEPHSLLLSGIVYGDLGDISSDFEDDLQATGTTHIVAVSGYNVTVLVASFAPLMSLFGRRIINIFAIVFIVFFMLFVGTDNVPVIRAGVMGVVLLLANLFGRKRGVIVFLSFTVAIFLLLNPLMFKQLSFQLSFLSTLGLIFLCDSIASKLTFIPEAFREDVASTFSAIFSTMPITLSNFNQISIIAPVANFFVLPIIPFITIGGFLFILLTLICPGGAKIIAYFFWLLLEYMVKVIEFFGSFDFAMLKVNSAVSKYVSIMLVLFLLCYLTELSYKRSLNEQGKDK